MNEAWDYLKNQFGVDRKDLSGKLKEKSGDYWLTRPGFEDLNVENEGLRLLRSNKMGLKPTTYALQLLDRHINKNIVEIDREELLDLLHRRRMIDRELDKEGYVAVKYNSRIIGVGYYKNEKVSSRIPKHRSKELAEIFKKSS